MYAVSDRFLEAIRYPPAIKVRVEVWRGGVRVDTYGDEGIPIHGGQVEVDGTRATRRTLTGLRVDATDEMWDLLSPMGTRLHCFRGFRYGSGGLSGGTVSGFGTGLFGGMPFGGGSSSGSSSVGDSEMVPLGQFVVGAQTEVYGGDWTGSVETAPDLMSLVDRAGLPVPRVFAAGTRIRDVAATLLSEVLGDVTVLATSTATLPSTAVYERDRLGAVLKLVESIGAMTYVDVFGGPVIADIPEIADTAAWDIDTGDSGVLYQASRTRSTDRTYSAVSASGAQIDGVAPFTPQVARDTNPDSPTYYLGDFGEVTYFMSSELFGSAAQALAAARAKLPLVTAVHAEMDIEAECNPALEAWDTVAIHLPARLRGQSTVTERHLAARFTVPLTPDGTQSLSTRSSVADLPDSE